ncbi:cyclopropane fatty acyl phospholipid synthase [Cyclobacterium jeungdonense]|uniref:Cyclopropane fatty acyl phospholipid synthase n=1 Tax=Cyclobacterium jeungdonense TaxID=708087 RepID=A0ABT8CCM0_9BACT|nr:cyclopropane fatty acyl phospholipid synthase [Cyclobacterium jeungdonense]MDN3690251.1 cyclopropane fatty acyl phospholipid synthase [Cyclobacterium jeungdonense]
MKTIEAKKTIQELLSLASININGNNSWDLQVHNEKFFNQVLLEGSLGAGESYMENWWDCKELDEFFTRIFKTRLQDKIRGNWKTLVQVFLAKALNLQNISGSFRSAKRHYDLGNDLFSTMLDQRMIYSCAYWKDAVTLEEAQEKKLKLTCLKLNLQPGMRVLDIGCGWGGFAKFASENYNVQVTGITVSTEQAKLAKETCKGLPVDIRLLDYRQVNETFDRVVSLGMFEHVGYKNYRTYMKSVQRSLKDDGLFLLHTIGSNFTSTWNDPWINHYIFPNSLLPSIQQIAKAIEGIFVMEDWHNFSADYDRTIMAWHKNFETNWEKLKDRYDERFYRMWNYYLLSCAGAFRSRKNQLWQVVLSKNGVPGGYISIR